MPVLVRSTPFLEGSNVGRSFPPLFSAAGGLLFPYALATSSNLVPIARYPSAFCAVSCYKNVCLYYMQTLVLLSM